MYKVKSNDAEASLDFLLLCRFKNKMLAHLTHFVLCVFSLMYKVKSNDAEASLDFLLIHYIIYNLWIK